MKRLVPLPLDDIRPATGRARHALNRELFYRLPLLIALLLALLVTISMVLHAKGIPSRGLWVVLPRPVANAQCEQVTLPVTLPHLVFIARDRQLYFDGKRIEQQDLALHLRRAFSAAPVPLIYVEGDSALNAWEVIAAVDAIKQIDPHLPVALVTPGMRNGECLVARVSK